MNVRRPLRRRLGSPAPTQPAPGARPALDPTWSPDEAVAAARRMGVHVLADHHWRVITAFREEVARTGHAPDVTELSRLTGFAASELARLFPGGVPEAVAHIAGLAREP